MKRFVTIACLLFCLLGYAQAKEKVIVRPPFVAWSSTSLEVDKVVMSDTATVLHIKAYYRPKYWIKIATGSFLKASNGETYPLRQGIGITPDKEFWMPESGEAEFQLVFPPLPDGITSIDFSEGDSEGAYQVFGIYLKGDQLPKLALPKEAIVRKTDNKASLPSPNMVAGTATLKGRILDYQPGVVGKLMLNIAEHAKGFSDGIEISLNPDGSFNLETPLMSTTPASIYLPGRQVKFFLAPGETSELIINIRELYRQQSKLHKMDKPYGEIAYINGPLAGVAQELNRDTLRSIMDNIYAQRMEMGDMDANAYKAFILGKHAEQQKKIEQTAFGKATRQLLHINNDICAAQAITLVANMLTQAKMAKKEIAENQAQAYYMKLEQELPADYYDSMKNFTVINTPLAVLSADYTYGVYMLGRMADKMAQVWGTKQGVFFDLATTAQIYQGIKDFTPLNDAQRGKLATLPPAYQTMLEAENTKLLEKIEANKKKSGFTINETGEVSNEDLFPSIIAKFRGKVVLIDFWATWCGPCRTANKAMVPMKEELKDKEIVYIYLAGENSPLKTWENMIVDIHGEHFRVTDAQWKYLMDAFKVGGVPTYILVDREGNIVYKTTGFPGADTMKKKILEAIDKK